MEFYDTIEKRRSVRSFRDESINEDSLKKILEAARTAPSANNAQDYKFVVVRNADKRQALAMAAMEQSFIAEAPILIAAVALNPNYMMENEVPAYAVDLAIAIDHMTLAAVQEDLGTCWIGAFDQDKVRRILNVPSDYKVVALLPLGVPRDEAGVKSRKRLIDLTCEEQFSE